MSSVLCIDTSAGTAIALVRGPQVATAASADPRAHAELLAPLIESVGAGDDVESVVVGTGPAPFTGLRVGLVTARAFAAARGIDCFGVSALDALARQGFDRSMRGEVTVVTDARRREVYTARFAADGADDVRLLDGPRVLRPAEIDPAASVVGRVDLLDEQHAGARLALTLDPAVYARIAAARRRAGRDLPTEPLYLREPETHRR